MREAVRGNGPVDKTGTAPRTDFTTHRSKRMQTFITAHQDWLTVMRLPAYAPELNPTEGVWSHLKRGLGNCAATSIDQLVPSRRPGPSDCSTAQNSSTDFSARPSWSSSQFRHDQHRPWPFTFW